MPREDWRVVEYRGRSALERVEADWRRLYSAMPLRSSAHLFEAHLAYYRHLMVAPESLRCLALTDGERVRAICPLVARLDKALGIPIPAWVIPSHLLNAVADAICPEDDARRALVPAIAAFLRQRPDGRPLLVVGPAPVDSALWEGVRRLDPLERSVHETHRLFVVDCTRSFDELESKLSRRTRQRLRNRRRKLEKLKDVRFETAADDEALVAALETFLEVEASGWKGATGTRTAIRFKPDQPAFFRELASTFACGDRCEINSLHADGRCIASQFCMRTGSEYAVVKIGYDEEYARLGPGQLLLHATLERLCRDPDITHLNVMSGAAWLEAWNPDRRVLQQAHVGLGRWSSMPLAALLRFRFGRGRTIARWVSRQYLERRGARGDTAAGPPAAAAPRHRTEPPATSEQSG